MHASRYSPARRAFDAIGAGIAVLVALVPLVVIAAMIKLSDPSAPVLFRQRRCGGGGRLFDLLKFRTMVKNADELKEALRDQSEVPWPDFRLRNDPRVTRLGRFLRKTSLDELPQLFNVLRGDMALIGPRPTSFHAETYELWQTERLELRPGITGPWQVWGRSTLDFEDRCRLEISFFRSARLSQNLRVLFATVGALLRRSGVA
jgi:lipopolysaccharide/colanic/teichoic acid biosynthesis glycosyltransferase